MPSLSYVASSYIKRVRDSLMTGPGYASAYLALGSGTSAFNITAREPGAGGNSITVAVTVPGGTSGLAVTATGTAITIALAVNAGVVVGASNTAALIVAAINASATANLLVEASLVGSGAGSLSVAAAATALAGGVSGSASQQNVETLPMNFLRAQDVASVLELLQDALDSGTLTATGGTATSVQDTGAFVANTQVGNLVTFTGNTTAALAGVTATVVSNTTGALFFANGAIPTAPAAGDTYTVRGAVVEPIISKLRDGRGSGSSAAANLYGDSRLVTDAFVRLTRQLGGTVSNVTLMSGVCGTGSTTTNVVLNMRGLRLRPDQFKGKVLTVGGESRKIVGNDDVGVFFSKPLTSAPAADAAFTIALQMDSTDADSNYQFAAGGQFPGASQNRRLAELIRVAEAAVVAFVTPT